MRASQVAVVSFEKRRRPLLLFRWTLISCCLMQLYQIVNASQEGPNNSLSELYASPRAQHGPVMDNLRRQMGRLNSSPVKRRSRQERMATPFRAHQNQVVNAPSSLDASRVLAPQLINEQSVANIRLKLSMIERQIKEIYALLDSLTPSDQKVFELAEVNNLAPKLEPDSNTNPLSFNSPSSNSLNTIQSNQEMQQNIIKPLLTRGIVSEQERVSSPVAMIGSVPVVGEAGPLDSASLTLGFNGGGSDQAGAGIQTSGLQEQSMVEIGQFSALNKMEPNSVGSSGAPSDGLQKFDSVSAPFNLPQTIQPQPSSFPQSSQTPPPVVISVENEQRQDDYNRVESTGFKRDTSSKRKQEKVNQEPASKVDLPKLPTRIPPPMIPRNDPSNHGQQQQQQKDLVGRQDAHRQDINMVAEAIVSSERSDERESDDSYLEEDNNNLLWDNQGNHELEQFYQQEGEGKEQEQRGDGRKKRKKHRLREAMMKGARLAKDVATVGLHKAQLYSPVVDAVTRKVQDHVVPVVSEAIEDGKDVVQGVSHGLKKSRSRRRAHKKSRKRNRTILMEVNDGAMADMDLERSVPDMLGAYPNVPPEVQQPY